MILSVDVNQIFTPARLSSLKMAAWLAATKPHLTLDWARHHEAPRTVRLQMVRAHRSQRNPAKPSETIPIHCCDTELISKVCKVNTDTFQTPLTAVKLCIFSSFLLMRMLMGNCLWCRSITAFRQEVFGKLFPICISLCKKKVFGLNTALNSFNALTQMEPHGSQKQLWSWLRGVSYQRRIGKSFYQSVSFRK